MSQTDETTLIARIEERLANVELLLDERASVHDSRVDQLTTYLKNAGGKRLRPTLTLLCSYVGENPEDPAVERVAAAIELTHLASLYHDDVMDDAPYRRGAPSAQVVFSNSAAILSGDILFARANALMARLSPRAVWNHSVTFARLCKGQLREWLGPEEGEGRLEYYLGVLADKTGSLIAAAAREGVLCAGGSDEDAKLVEAYGEKVGVAFQLADDYIDVMSDSDQLGKTSGTDLREGVDTMPTILLRERREAGTLDAAGARILEVIDSVAAIDSAARAGAPASAPSGLQSGLTPGARPARELDDGELAEVLGLLRQHSVMEETLGMARAWAEDAVAGLSAPIRAKVGAELGAFATAAVDRVS